MTNSLPIPVVPTIDWFRQVDPMRRSLADLAAEAGWDSVEAALADYKVLPDAFFQNSSAHFASVRQNVLAAA